jgi:hypothetical protein
MSDAVSSEQEQQYGQYRQQSKQDFDQYFTDFERTAQQGSLEEITQWKDLFQQLAQSYNEAAQGDPNNDKQQAWRAAAENMDYAAQTLGTINDMDTSGFADSLRNAQGSMQNVTGERDGEDDEKKASLRDHRQRATETSNRLDQMSGQASDVKRMPRRDVEQMRSDMKDMHQNTQSTSNEHRGADEQAGEHYDTALEHMNNANQWGDSLGGCFDQSDAVVEAMRAAQEALNQVAAQ